MLCLITNCWQWLTLEKYQGTTPCTWHSKPSTALWKESSVSLIPGLRSVNMCVMWLYGTQYMIVITQFTRSFSLTCSFGWTHTVRCRFPACHSKRAECSCKTGWTRWGCGARPVLHGAGGFGSYECFLRRLGRSGSYKGEVRCQNWDLFLLFPLPSAVTKLPQH